MATSATLPARHAPHLAAPDVNPSFTRGVFRGELREDLVFPFPELSAEEAESLRMILGTFQDFAASADPSLGNQLDDAGAALPRHGGGMFGDA